MWAGVARFLSNQKTIGFSGFNFLLINSIKPSLGIGISRTFIPAIAEIYSADTAAVAALCARPPDDA